MYMRSGKDPMLSMGDEILRYLRFRRRAFVVRMGSSTTDMQVQR
ncbi:unnamed protein product [Rhodiola kirilowii]